MPDGQLRRLARGAAKAAWWTLTPWKAKARLDYLRARAKLQNRVQELDAIARIVADQRVGPSQSELDLFDADQVSRLADMPAAAFDLSTLGADAVTDRRTAAGFVLNLWRNREDLRFRFPRLFRPSASGMGAWFRDEFAGTMSRDAIREIEGLFPRDYAQRARQAFLVDTEMRAILPHGLTPPGIPALLRWFIRAGMSERGLHLEEVMWLLLGAQQSPADELLAAHAFTPAWQRVHPVGRTRFGREAFAGWFAEEYGVAAAWLDTADWPDAMSVLEQVRTAYWANPTWRRVHPKALSSDVAALHLLQWLSTREAGLTPAAISWVEVQRGPALAAAMAADGINVIGHFTYPSGLRVSVESLVQAAGTAAIPVSLRDVRTDAKDDPHHAEYRGEECFDVTVLHTQPTPYFDDVYERADLAPREPRPYRIAYWYWEFDSIPEAWLQQAELVDEVWTATEFVAKGLRARLSKPVRTMFPGVKLAPYKRRPREYFGLESAKYTFLFTFHMMSVMERKNPLGLIRAFRLAFDLEDSVQLVLKTSFGDRHPAQIEELRSAGDGHNIRIIDAVYSPDEVLSLMDCCDAYVSLHRSEGLGLTMAEAMLMAKPVIATHYSGNVDFMDASNSVPVSYTLRPLGRAIPPYDAGLEWAEPSTEGAARAMRQLFDDQISARELGLRAQASAFQRLSLDAAGQRMAQRLREIRALREPPNI